MAKKPNLMDEMEAAIAAGAQGPSKATGRDLMSDMESAITESERAAGAAQVTDPMAEMEEAIAEAGPTPAGPGFGVRALQTAADVAESWPAKAFIGTLDFLRRGSHTLAAKAGDFAYDMATGFQHADARMTWRNAWDATITGADELDAWGDIYGLDHVGEAWSDLISGGEFERKHPVLHGLAADVLPGVGYEIVSDPLNLLAFAGQLTKAGKAARTAGTLGKTFRAQAMAKPAQRALVSFLRPTMKAGKLAFEWTPVVKGAKAVGAIGDFGAGTRFMVARLLGHQTAKSLPEFRAGLEALKQAKRAAAVGTAEPIAQLLRYQDEITEMFKGVPQDTVEQVLKAAESAGKPGWRAVEFAAHTPEVQALARSYVAKVAETVRHAQDAGLKTGTFGGELMKTFDALDTMEVDEVAAMTKAFQSDLEKLGGQQRQIFSAILKQRRTSATQSRVATNLTDVMNTGRRRQAEVWEMVKAAKREGKSRPVYEQLQDAEKFIATAETQRGTALRAAQVADAKALALQREMSALQETSAYWRGTFKLDNKALRAIREQKFIVGRAMDDMPNFVPHVLTPKGLRRVLKAHGKSFSNRVWSDAGEFIVERHFTKRVFEDAPNLATTKTLRELSRSLSIDEVAKLMKRPDLTGKIASYAEFAKGDNVFHRIEQMFGKGRDVKIARMFKLDPQEAFQRMSQRMIQALRSKEFIGSVLGNPDMVASVARPHWVALRELSEEMADQLGDMFVHPGVAREMRRTYTAMFQPEALNMAVRAFDHFTRLFKKSVTTPESLVEGGLTSIGKALERRGLHTVGRLARKAGQVAAWIPGFPAYHLRNAYSDFTLMSYNGAFDPAGVVEAGWKAMRRKGKINLGKQLGTLPADEVRRMAQSYGVLFSELNEMGHGVSKIGGSLEDMRRTGYFVDRLRKGFSPYQAALDTKRVLFDYSDMSTVEREVFRRIIPFWAWVRNNAKMQATQIFRAPGVMAAQFRLAGRPERAEDAPPWIRGRLAVALEPNKQTGAERLLLGVGLPVEDIVELLDIVGNPQGWVKDVTFRLNPLLRAPVEMLTAEKRPKATTKSAAAIIKAAGMENLVGLRQRKGKGDKLYYTMDPRYEQLFRVILNRFYTTEKRFESPFVEPGQALLPYLTGLSVREFDPREERRKEKKRAAGLQLDRLLRTGDVRAGQYIYESRESELGSGEFQRLKQRLGR